MPTARPSQRRSRQRPRSAQPVPPSMRRNGSGQPTASISVEMGDEAFAVAVGVGDSAAAATVQWTVDAVIVPVERRQELGV